MIRNFHVTDFKNLADVGRGVEFGALNAIIGPNGCGKSSLLQSIDFLRAFFYPSIEDYLHERDISYADLPNLRQKRKSMTWHVVAELDAGQNGARPGTYEYTVSSRLWRFLGVGAEKLVFTPVGGPPEVLVDRSGRKVSHFIDKQVGLTVENMPRSMLADLPSRLRPRVPEVFRFCDWVTSIRSFLLWDPKVLRKPDRGKHLELGPSGEHLAPVLARIKREHPERFSRIVRRIKGLVPTVSAIGVKGGKGWGWQRVTLTEGAARGVEFSSEQTSDGILRLLALLSLLESEKRPSVLTLEEPENGMHPQLVSEVIEVLREFSLTKSPRTTQVFFTTHSPYVLDGFVDHPDQVYVMERGKPLEGANLSRLSTRGGSDRVKSAFAGSLGEAWYSGLIGGASGGR